MSYKLKDRNGNVMQKDYAKVELQFNDGRSPIVFFVESHKFDELNAVLKYCDWFSEPVEKDFENSVTVEV